jgi:hypothetical protein
MAGKSGTKIYINIYAISFIKEDLGFDSWMSAQNYYTIRDWRENKVCQ